MISQKYLVIVSMLFLWFAMPVHCSETSVLIYQEGTAREPFDVGKTIIYDVQLTGISNSMLYTLEMLVGPDNLDPSIYKNFKTEINAKSTNSGKARFPVNFQSPDFRRGEFGKWLNDQNRTETWEKAWYKVMVTSLNPFEEPKGVEDYSGKPALIKIVEEFKDQQVIPTKGTNADRFEYEVSVFSTIKDNITLETGPTRNGPWTKVGSQSYATPGSWQILKWPNVTLDFDFASAAYRINGRKQITFDGPYWPIDIEFNNSSVIPYNGLSDMPFTYSIEVMAPKAIDVGLNVWDISNKRYNSAGRLSYNNASQWDTLAWKDVKPSSSAESSGDSNYYFSFYYKNSDSPFATTYENYGKYYPGPALTMLNLTNWTVSPGNGTLFTPYNYSVTVKTRLPKFDIELQTLSPGSEIWISKGMATFDGGNNTLVWKNVSFDPNDGAVGNGTYRFMLGDTVLGEFIGPKIDVAFMDMTYNRIGKTDRFDYKVKIKSSKPSQEIELIYTDDGLIWTRSHQVQVYRSNSQEWKELVWKNQPWHKTIRFDVMRT